MKNVFLISVCDIALDISSECFSTYPGLHISHYSTCQPLLPFI